MTNIRFAIDRFPRSLLLFRAIRLRREATVGEKAPGFFSPDDPEKSDGTKRGVPTIDAGDREDRTPFCRQNRQSSNKSGQKGRVEGTGSPCGRRKTTGPVPGPASASTVAHATQTGLLRGCRDL
jgi:hypothetical protein